MLPKIQFHRSHVYDEHLKRDADFVMPSDEFIYSNTRKLEVLWRKYEKKILGEIEKVSGLKWRESHIYIYITAGVGYFSAPMTMSITKDTEFLFDTMVHELIHRIISENENWSKIEKKWMRLMGKYQNEEFVTRTHLPIHAIHNHVYLKFFDKKRLDKEIKYMEKNDKLYARSWQIVSEVGYGAIIKAINPKYKPKLRLK